MKKIHVSTPVPPHIAQRLGIPYRHWYMDYEDGLEFAENRLKLPFGKPLPEKEIRNRLNRIKQGIWESDSLGYWFRAEEVEDDRA